MKSSVRDCRTPEARRRPGSMRGLYSRCSHTKIGRLWSRIHARPSPLDESADLLFHYLILLQAKGVRLNDIVDVLKNRHK